MKLLDELWSFTVPRMTSTLSLLAMQGGKLPVVWFVKRLALACIDKMLGIMRKEAFPESIEL